MTDTIQSYHVILAENQALRLELADVNSRLRDALLEISRLDAGRMAQNSRIGELLDRLCALMDASEAQEARLAGYRFRLAEETK